MLSLTSHRSRIDLSLRASPQRSFAPPSKAGRRSTAQMRDCARNLPTTLQTFSARLKPRRSFATSQLSCSCLYSLLLPGLQLPTGVRWQSSGLCSLGSCKHSPTFRHFTAKLLVALEAPDPTASAHVRHCSRRRPVDRELRPRMHYLDIDLSARDKRSPTFRHLAAKLLMALH
jgi:hypothetical protein